MPRAIWKGAITFGLVLVPVALYPASQEVDIDFDWLDKRSMDPVGYKRINKRTGKEIASENIVKGIRQESGEYVVLSEDEIRAAYPKTMQTIEIEAFVDAREIAPVYFEKPYYLEPIGKGEKVYSLLREAMIRANVIGIARVVLHTKEHLAALIPSAPALMLNTLRWAGEIRDGAELVIAAAGNSSPELKAGELKMAQQLIQGMIETWHPERYQDQFSAAVLELVARKIKAGKTEKVEPLESAPDGLHESNVVDLSELLRKSLAGRPTAAEPAAAVVTGKRAAAKAAKAPQGRAVKAAARKRA